MATLTLVEVLGETCSTVLNVEITINNESEPESDNKFKKNKRIASNNVIQTLDSENEETTDKTCKKIMFV